MMFFALTFLVIAQTNTLPSLKGEVVNVTNMCFIEWIPDPTIGGTGSGHTTNIIYTGPAFQITAVGLQNLYTGLLVESSTDLSNWNGYPQDGFQLTLITTNATSILIMDRPQLFFRGKLSRLYFN